MAAWAIGVGEASTVAVAVGGVHQTGGVDDGNGGVATVGGAGPGEALMASAVGVLEVPLEGLGRLPSQHQSR